MPESKVQEILEALAGDLEYDLPLNYQIGAGDTYFSGKMLAKLARLLVISSSLGDSVSTAVLLSRLKSRLEVWTSLESEARLLYDETWGGVVSCGCVYDDCGGLCSPYCNNDKNGATCPAMQDEGMNFGNGAYNDHHFHYGYFLYAAAAAASVDGEWAKEYAESGLLFARDFVNPSDEDVYFPRFRMLDWYAGHSWAGGISTGGGQAYYNGRNQESSSESVHAYYAAALFGRVLKGLAGYEGAGEELERAGRVALALELRAADKYWHVYEEDFPEGTDGGEPNVYDEVYRGNGVVGILWSGLAQFQTCECVLLFEVVEVASTHKTLNQLCFPFSHSSLLRVRR